MKGNLPFTVLRAWLWITGTLLALWLIWVLAPVLFLLVLLTAAIGLVSAVMVWLARRLEAWKNQRPPPV